MLNCDLPIKTVERQYEIQKTVQKKKLEDTEMERNEHETWNRYYETDFINVNVSC